MKPEYKLTQMLAHTQGPVQRTILGGRLGPPGPGPAKIIFWTGGIDIGELLFLFFIYSLLISIDYPAFKLNDDLFLRKFPNWFSGVIISLGIFGIIFSMVTQSSSARPFIYFQF